MNELTPVLAHGIGGRSHLPRAAAPPSAPERPEPTHWPAAAGLGAFLWLELCYHDPSSPRVLGLALVAYTVGGLLLLLGA